MMKAKKLKHDWYAVRLDETALVYIVDATNAQHAMRRAAARHWRHHASPMPTNKILSREAVATDRAQVRIELARLRAELARDD